MEELSRGGRIDPHLVDLRWVIAEVLDVTEHVSLAILTQFVAKQRADGEVDCGRLFDGPRSDWEAFNEDEALAVDNKCAYRR